MFNRIKSLVQKYPWLLPVVGIVFIAFVLALFLGKGAPSVPSLVTAEPITSAPISIYPVFTFTFNRTPTQDQKTHFTALLVPNAALISSWQENVLTVIPTSGLNPESQYTLSVSYDQEILSSLTYTTLSLDNLKQEDQTRAQTQADYNFAQEQDKLYQQKPWLDLLPITTNEYTVIYDFDLQKLRIRLKAPYTEAQKTALLQNLSQKGIPTGSIDWIQQ